MCGIAGFIGDGGRTILKRMTDAIAHRGPDGEGFYLEPESGVHLGHRRLSIIDINRGDQPMWNEDNTVCVVFNGEIYNHRTLRTELEARGHRFSTDHSDTEVLVHGYEEWRDELPLHLDGMFAYAILDRLSAKILLSRDRFGEKPLFWAQRGETVMFASEITALRVHPLLADAGLDPIAVRKFMAHGFIPAPASGFTGIEKLPHGHTLTIDLQDRTTTVRRWWRYEIEADNPPPGTIGDWCEELAFRLDAAVASRLESDVPLGLFLSGGIDSSTLLSFAANHIPASEIRCFSIGFDEESYDETAYAAEMARHVGAQHALETCALSEQAEQITPLLARIGEPIGDPSILPTYQLCRFARRSVTVALSGDGGDELFAGYDPFQFLGKAQFYHKLVPRPVHAAVSALAELIPRSDRNMSLDFKIRRGLRGLGLPPRYWNPVWLAPFSISEIAELVEEPVQKEELYAEAIAAWETSRATSIVDRTQEFYANFYMAEGILMKTDRAAMLNGLEVRAPFLANNVVDFSRRLPASVKLRNGEGKWILRRAMEKRLPTTIVKRKKKGFGIPLSSWLRQIQPPATTPFLDFLDQEHLVQLWQEHAGHVADHRNALFCWLSLYAAAKPGRLDSSLKSIKCA